MKVNPKHLRNGTLKPAADNTAHQKCSKTAETYRAQDQSKAKIKREFYERMFIEIFGGGRNVTKHAAWMEEVTVAS